ncbi:MAG: eL32 family ribosomal protein [Candidatus Diapherotrites archaeon]
MKEETKEVKNEKEKPQKKEKKSRKVVKKASKETAKKRKLVLTKARLPTFRGHFGKRSIRRKSKEKWNKWRFPRGIDMNHDQSEGFMPRVGYRTIREIRGYHPSGYKEVRVKSIKELEVLPKEVAVRIASGIGKKKKLMIVDKAIELGLKVLNP